MATMGDKLRAGYDDWLPKALGAGYTEDEARRIHRKWKSLGLRVWAVGAAGGK